MKKYLNIIIGLSLLIVTAVNVSADPMEFIDTFDAGHNKITFLESVSWEFDIKKDGFDPLSMKVIEASMELSLEDDDQDLWIFNREIAGLLIEETQLFLWEVDTDDYKFEISSLLSLNEDGKISASLVSTLGDFYFNSATLVAIATPEPNTLSLICFGLMGLLGINYIRKKK
jgi:hypothetical protein